MTYEGKFLERISFTSNANGDEELFEDVIHGEMITMWRT
jgi:hypothetical protein